MDLKIITFLVFLLRTSLAKSNGTQKVFFRSVLLPDRNISAEITTLWMDIREGIYPNISSNDNGVAVDVPITVLIYLNSSTLQDVTVNKCLVYNGDKLNLTLQEFMENQDKKLVLVNKWTKQVYNTTNLLYTNLTSFKFPDSEYVNIACGVKLCSEKCVETGENPEGSLRGITDFFNKLLPTPAPYKVDCKPKNVLCMIEQFSFCYQSQPLQCQQPCKPSSKSCSSNYSPTCSPGSKDPKCQNTTVQTCYPGSQNPNCSSNPSSVVSNRPSSVVSNKPSNVSSNKPSNVLSNKPSALSNQPSTALPNNPSNALPDKPSNVVSDKPPASPVSQSLPCYPGSQDPSCSTLVNYTSPPKPQHNGVPLCYPGSSHPSCVSHPPSSDEVECTDSNCDSVPVCYPGSQHPKCTASKPLNCFPHSKDPKCNQAVVQQSPPNCYPGSQHPQCKVQSSPCSSGSCGYNSIPLCYPGSQNVYCKTMNKN